MRVFLLSTGTDTAGQAAAIWSALAHQRPTWMVDQMRRLDRWGYPTQRPYRLADILRCWRRATVVHLTETLDAFGKFGRGAKPMVVHHHGDFYRQNRDEIDAACRKLHVVQVASTLDLLGLPGVEWLPVVADLDALRKMRRPANDGIVRIATSPTDRTIKGTAMVEAAVGRMQRGGLPVVLDVIEDVSWSECLVRKARADIFVDQFELGYGLSAVEAWGLGQPVVAGVTNPITRDRMIEHFGSLPFVEAGPESLEAVLTELVLDPTCRAEWAAKGNAHAQRFHSEAATANRLDQIYARAVRSAAA